MPNLNPPTRGTPRPARVVIPLGLDDPRYLRRLVRAANHHPTGTMLDPRVAGTDGSPRLSGKAHYSESEKVIFFPGRIFGGDEVIYRITPERAGTAFTSAGSGETIVASRVEV